MRPVWFDVGSEEVKVPLQAKFVRKRKKENETKKQKQKGKKER